MAATLIADAKTDEEKIERLYDFCRNKIKNTSNDASGLTPDERAKLKDNKNPSDTLKRGMGTGGDIDLLFAALANASGFDARIVLASRSRRSLFRQSDPNAYFVDPQNIGVSIGGKWQFFNPGYNYIPFGMLRWQEEGQPALITDPKRLFGLTCRCRRHKSLVKRNAKLKLSDDGTLEGDIRIEFPAISRSNARKTWMPSPKTNVKRA